MLFHMQPQHCALIQALSFLNLDSSNFPYKKIWTLLMHFASSLLRKFVDEAQTCDSAVYQCQKFTAAMKSMIQSSSVELLEGVTWDWYGIHSHQCIIIIWYNKPDLFCWQPRISIRGSAQLADACNNINLKYRKLIKQFIMIRHQT